MIIIKIEKGMPLERALKLYKSKIIKTKQSSELVKRKEFEKPSVKNRKQILKAKYIQSLNSKKN
jgi:small subunit ribosomal protein S21